MREFDVPYNILDSSKLSNETHWQAEISFEKGIQKTWDWFYRKET